MKDDFNGHEELSRIDQHLGKVLKNFRDENAWLEFALFCSGKLSKEKKLQLIDTVKAKLPQQCVVCGKEVTLIEWLKSSEPMHFHVTCKDHLEVAGMYDILPYKIANGFVKI